MLTAFIASGEGVTYTWDFGDGTTGSGVSVMHTYDDINRYTAKVVATNSMGEATAQVKVQVGSRVYIPILPHVEAGEITCLQDGNVPGCRLNHQPE